MSYESPSSLQEVPVLHFLPNRILYNIQRGSSSLCDCGSPTVIELVVLVVLVVVDKNDLQGKHRQRYPCTCSRVVHGSSRKIVGSRRIGSNKKGRIHVGASSEFGVCENGATPCPNQMVWSWPTTRTTTRLLVVVVVLVVVRFLLRA